MADGDYERRDGRLAEIKRLERLLKGFADAGHGQNVRERIQSQSTQIDNEAGGKMKEGRTT